MTVAQLDQQAEQAAAAEFAAEQAKPKPVLSNPDGTPNRDGWRRIGERLRKEMPHRERKGPGGKMFSYITARQVQDRLDAVVGPGNWQSDWTCIRSDHPVAARVGVAIFGVWKWDVGYSNNPEADDEQDRGYEQEPLKAAVSDGFKRAAVQWGVGRFLYGDGA